MIKSPSLLVVLFSTLLLACQKEEETITPETQDECQTVKSSNHGKIIEDQYIVSIKNEDLSTGRNRVAKASRVMDRHKISSQKVLKKVDGELSHYVLELSQQEAAALKSDTDIALIEPDRIVSICACFTVIEPKTVTWNVERVGYGDGTDKKAWVIDTGIDLNHLDLNVDKARSRSFIEGETSPEDENGHGTHVAGIIGAKNNRYGTFGVASGATLIALKVLDDQGEGLLSDVLDALSYVRMHGKPGDVVNISIGVEDQSEMLDREIKGIASRNIYVALAAGNDGKSAEQFSPGRTNGLNIYTVSAVDSLNQFARFSNYGNNVDYAAPGVRILSSYTKGRYAYMSGTSMATPHVAGLLLINNGKIKTNGYVLNDPDGQPDPLAHK